MTTFLAIGVALAPVLAVIAFLKLADRIERRGLERAERQIILTDAIHRELGAIVAPTVERQRASGWRVGIAVPLDRPDMVATILRITDRVFGAAGEAYELLLTRQAVVRRPEVGHRWLPAAHRSAQRAA